MAELHLSRLAASAFLALLVAAWPAPGRGQSEVPPEGRRQITTIEFTEAKIVNAVRILAEMTGVNIAATREAGEKQISLFLRDVDARTAIDTICRTSGLWYRFDKATRSYLIMTVEQYKEDIIIYREDSTRAFSLRHQNVVTAALTIQNLYGSRVELNLETEDEDVLGKVGGKAKSGGSARSQSGDRRTQTAGGTSAQAALGKDDKPSPQQMEALGAEPGDDLQLSGQAVQDLLQREPPIYVTVNRLHNILFVRTSDDAALRGIADLIRQSDRPTPQVLLELKFLELTVDDTSRSQFNLNVAGGGLFAPENGGDPQRLFQLGAGNFPLGGGTFAFSVMHKKIQAQLELLAREGRVNVLASPMLLASNNREASLFIGEERPITTGIRVVTTAGSTINTTVAEPKTEQRMVGDSLKVTPRINGDRTVTLLIDQDSSTVLPDNAEITTVNAAGNIVTASVDTVQSARLSATVIAKDGLTVALGGMIRQSRNDTLQKIPLLGDLPLLGLLFRRDIDENVKREVILLVTPHIIMSPEESERVSRERLVALSANPNLDSYGFGASRNQPKLRQGQTTDDMIALTRYAAQKAHGEPEPLDGVTSRPVAVAGDIALLPDAAIRMKPLVSFEREGLFVTSVLMENTALRPVRLDEREVLGNWLAATFEATALSPVRTAGSRAYLHLLSDRPLTGVLALSPELVNR